MVNLLIVTKDSVGMAHWLEALTAHYPLQVFNTIENVLTYKPNSGAIDLIILDADFIRDDYSQLSLMADCANKIMIVGNNYPEALQVQAVVEGAWGYSEKAVNADLILRAVESLLKNEIWLERHQISRVVGFLNGKNGMRKSHQVKLPKQLLSCLTQRELAVAELIYQGEGNSSIALKLAISERTVKAHLSSTFRKLEVQDRLQLVVRLMNLDVSAAKN